MKKILITFYATLIGFAANATTRTVQNYPTGVAQFNEIQDAVNASVSGDTILIQGTLVRYAPFTTNDKKLIYMGGGYNPENDNALIPRLGVVGLNHTTTAPGSCSGSQFYGLRFEGAFNLGVSFSNTEAFNNIKFKRCEFTGTLSMLNPGPTFFHSNLVIENCYLNGPLNIVNINNFIFKNNVVMHSSSLSYFKNFGTTSGILIDHNLFYSASDLPLVNSGSTGIQFTNNIFNNMGLINIGGPHFFESNVTYNCNNNTPWSTGTNINAGGNIANANPMLTDQAAVDAAAISAILNFKPVLGSPCINAGSDGKDIGVLHEANTIYDFTQNRNGILPRVIKMDIHNPTGVTQGDTLHLSIGAVRAK